MNRSHLLSSLPRLRRHFSHLSPFSQPVVDHLRTHGYALYNHFLPAPVAAALRHEIDTLATQNLLSPNHTHITTTTATARRNAPLLFPKPHIYEAELPQLPSQILRNLPTLAALADDPTLPALLSVLWPRVRLTETAIKVQRAEGESACFPIHVDSAKGVDRRLVTALLYLNDDWCDARDGGALRVYPTPVAHEDVGPVEGRLVLMGSRGLHHRVLPARRRRYVVTVWCSGTLREEREPCVEEWGSVEERVAALLLGVEWRDVGFRLGLAEEWERSLWEAHGEKVGKEVVQVHRGNLERIREAVPGRLCKILGEQDEVEKVRGLVSEPGRLREVWDGMREQKEDALAFLW